MVPVIYIIGFVLIILYYNLSFVIPLRKLMADLGGKINYKFEGVFTFQGRDFFIKYIPGSRSRSPELKIYTHGSFGAEMLIRLENSFDKFYKAIGLNVEQSILDRMGSDKLYFECDDQDFLNLIFSNTKAKTDVLDLLRKYSAIVITKDSCQLNQYPVPDLSTITKDEILKSALELD